MTTQPEMAIVADLGNYTTFTAVATGSPAPTIQWQESSDRSGVNPPWASIPGATDQVLQLNATSSNVGHAFRAVFTNTAGTAVSRPARLVRRADWMEDLGSDIDGIPLTELTIPGTHDMGTYGISGDGVQSVDHQATACTYVPDAVCDSFSRAQDTDATTELNDGIRYFDLRVCGTGALPQTPYPPDFEAMSGDPVTCHGLVAAKLGQILFQTAAWAEDHPKELVILDFNHHFEVKPGLEASQIEAAFTRGDGTSMLVPPQYCTPTDPNSGTCAGNLTLSAVRAESGHPNVVVNFENDGAPGVTACMAYDNSDPPNCTEPFGIQPVLAPPNDLSFFDGHQNLWGRATGEINFEYCTRSGAFTSCFGNTTDRYTVLNRAIGAIGTRQTFAEPSPDGPPYKFQHFFVQFLQSTPDAKYMIDNPTSSLLDMATDPTDGTNTVVAPGILGCGDWGINDCWAQYRPENLNILAINFYDQPVSRNGEPIDFVRAILRFDDYAHTAPVVNVTTATQPATSGWYNAATLGGQGDTLAVSVSAADYWWPTGINTIDCSDSGTPATFKFPITSTVPTGDGYGSATESATLGEGLHAVGCTATDGAAKGLHGVGNTGAGPGSTAMPLTFNVDTVPPIVHCPDAQHSQLLLHQPVSSLVGTVTDDTSGPATPTASASISTAQVGSFTATLTASDNAGNPASAVCTYTVSYQPVLRYDPTKQWASGSTVPIQIELDDFYGVDVSSKTVTVTATSVLNTVAGTTVAPTSPGATKTFTFYVSPKNGYEYDLQTKGYTTSSYLLHFIAGKDPITHNAPFRIK